MVKTWLVREAAQKVIPTHMEFTLIKKIITKTVEQPDLDPRGSLGPSQ